MSAPIYVPNANPNPVEYVIWDNGTGAVARGSGPSYEDACVALMPSLSGHGTYAVAEGGGADFEEACHAALHATAAYVNGLGDSIRMYKIGREEYGYE